MVLRSKLVRQSRPNKTKRVKSGPLQPADENSWVDKGGMITLEQWEERVFLSATSYHVSVRVGPGRNAIKVFRTYPEAMVVALHVPRAYLYAVTDKERSFNVVRAKFGHYLDIYNRAVEKKNRLGFPKPPYSDKTQEFIASCST